MQQAPVEIADHAFEGLLDRVALLAIGEGQADRLAGGAMQDHDPHLDRQILPERIEAEAELGCEAGQHLHVVRRRRVALGPGHHRPLLEAERFVGHHQLRFEQQLFAEAIAGRTSTHRRVKAEQPRLEAFDGEAGDRASEFLAEDDAVVRQAGALHSAPLLPFPPRRHAIRQVEIDQSLGQFQRLFKTVGQPRFNPFAHRDPVNHHLDVVLVLLVERGGVLDRVELAVDPHAGEAGLLPFGQLLAVLPLAPAHHRSEQVGARPLGQGHHPVDHLADRLRRDRQAGGGRVWHANPRPQQPHVVIDLGHRGDGRARVAAGGLLLDRDRGAQPVDMLDIGLLHHLEELAGIGRQALDIAPLPLGIDRIEREAALPRARKPRDHDQAVARQRDVKALEVMLARPAHGDVG